MTLRDYLSYWISSNTGQAGETWVDFIMYGEQVGVTPQWPSLLVPISRVHSLKSARNRLRYRGDPLLPSGLCQGWPKRSQIIRFGTGLLKGRLLCGGPVRSVALYGRNRASVAR